MLDEVEHRRRSNGEEKQHDQHGVRMDVEPNPLDRRANADRRGNGV
jgi:hypothetical protein